MSDRKDCCCGNDNKNSAASVAYDNDGEDEDRPNNVFFVSCHPWQSDFWNGK